MTVYAHFLGPTHLCSELYSKLLLIQWLHIRFQLCSWEDRNAFQRTTVKVLEVPHSFLESL